MHKDFDTIADWFRRALIYYNIFLAGGDTTSYPGPPIFTITALGDNGAKKVGRSGAKKGDLILVSGEIGDSFIGLQLLQKNNIKSSFDSALMTPMVSIAEARARQMQLYQSFSSVFKDYDIVICPGVSIPPFPWKHRNPLAIDGKPVENYMAWLALTSSLTVIGHPVVALPCGLDNQGTPFGIQVVGRMYSDHRLLSIASGLEGCFSQMSALKRPVPDFDALSKFDSTCRTLGELV